MQNLPDPNVIHPITGYEKLYTFEGWNMRPSAPADMPFKGDTENDARKVFDSIPELFDKWRPRYSKELFDFIVKTTGLGKGKRCLEIGPGTGQATDFALESGCDYTSIELGEHLTAFMKKKYSERENFSIINADFEKYDFPSAYYDLVYSAAAIQWINQDIAYKKCFDIIKVGGYLAMFLVRHNYKDSNLDLYNEIQTAYDKFFVSDQPYTRKFDYMKAKDYGFSSEEFFDFPGERIFSADDYIEYIGTNSDHIKLNENYRDKFFTAVHNAIVRHGNRLVMKDTYVLYLCKK